LPTPRDRNWFSSLFGAASAICLVGEPNAFGVAHGGNRAWSLRRLGPFAFHSFTSTSARDVGVSEEDVYRPIACGLHDRLEESATLGRTVRVVFRGEGGALQEVEDQLVDVFARFGVEFVRTASGSTIRLDRLESVDGFSFRS